MSKKINIDIEEMRTKFEIGRRKVEQFGASAKSGR